MLLSKALELRVSVGVFAVVKAPLQGGPDLSQYECGTLIGSNLLRLLREMIFRLCVLRGLVQLVQFLDNARVKAPIAHGGREPGADHFAVGVGRWVPIALSKAHDVERFAQQGAKR